MRSGVTGVNELIAKLKGFGADAEKALQGEVVAIANQIVTDAKQNASAIPGAPQEIKQYISADIGTDKLTGFVTQNSLPMGAYIEFGTGVYVRVAPEWKDMAWQFFVNGKGRLRAHPYMYPAFIKGRDDFMVNIEKNIKKLSNKFNRR